MQIVVDANPLISMLISPGKPIDLLFLEELELVAPSLLFDEIEHNKDLIISKSNLSRENIEGFVEILKAKIKVIPWEDFFDFVNRAEHICPHDKDVPYFALALYLVCSLWTNEKKLKNQKIVSVYSTHELIHLFAL
jgi:predicted nucleic acid-binding protein